jgi:4-hydroxy-tetrahydrodipicolinate synthase
MKFVVEGVIPAVVTPFDEQEQLNEPALRLMIRRLIDAGVHGLFGLGTNGEFYALTFEEKVRVTEIMVEEAAGKLPVYAGAGCTSTRETIALVKRLEAIGVDAVSVITPYFIKYTQDELVDHFKRIADATALPITLYNMPDRTTNALLPKSVATLAQVPNILGIKDSSGSFDTILQYLECASTKFSILSGNDGLILSTLMAGGRGTVSAMANIAPETVVSIYEMWHKGEFKKAEEAQRALRVARGALRLGTQPSALKAFLKGIGLPAGPARQPVSALSEQEQIQLEQIIKAFQSL